MPSSSRIKSHKESKHSSRKYDDIDIRVSKDSLISGEKRKLFENRNAYQNDEFSKTTKRQKDKIDGDDGEVVNIDVKKLKSKDLLKDNGESKICEKKYDKESRRKEGSQVKENKYEKEMKVENEAKKRVSENNEWPIEEELRNIDYEKELKTRMTRREGYSDKDSRYKDEDYKNQETSSKSRDAKHRRESDKDNKHKSDKNREDRDYRRKEERYRDDFERDYRHETTRDDTDRRKRSRDHYGELETKHSKDDSRGESPIYDDRDGRRKHRRRDCNKDETKDNRSRGGHDDVDITSNHSRCTSSPSGKSYSSRDHRRVSNQDKRSRRNINKDDKNVSQSLEKITQKDDYPINDLSVQNGQRSCMRSSTVSPSTSNIRRDLNRQNVWGNPNFSVEELSNRHQRSGDLSMRNLSNGQTNWNNFSNWSTPIVNRGYFPFHQVPPPFFNPVMPPFLPPIFGQPLMNINHTGMPFYGPPPFHGYGNWNQKIDHLVDEPTDDIWSGQTGHPDMEAETINKAPEIVKVTREDDRFTARAYLSKIDISKDLSRPNLYDQCRSILDLNQESDSDESDCKILFVEGVEDITNGASLFPAIDESVFKKAMALYTKNKVPFNSASDQEKSCSVDEQQKLDLDPLFNDNNIDESDEKLLTSNAIDMELVENQDDESCAPSSDSHNVKNEDSCNQDVNKKIDISSGDDYDSLLISTNVSNIELGSVNLSRIHHSPESTH